LLAVLRSNLVIPSPGPLRERLLSLAVYRRKGRLPKGERRVVRWYANRGQRGITLPRGLVHRISTMVPLQVVDRRVKLPPLDFGWRGQLRPEQSEAALPLYRSGGGILVGLPGAGKTEVGLALVAAWRQPALWLVHTRRLAGQATERARRWYNLPRGAIGFVGQGIEEWGTHITVGMLQTFLHRRFPEEKRIGTVVVDECHHMGALGFCRVLARMPGRYRLGLTATPERTDGLGPLVQAVLGPRVVEVSSAALIRRGVVVLPQVLVVPTRFKHYGSGEWNALERERSRDSRRNALICSIAGTAYRRGRRVLVMVNRRDHANLLAGLLARGWRLPAVALTGLLPDKRIELAEKWARGARAILVCTRLIDEGWDFPGIDCLIFASPGRSPVQLKQQVGRVMRAAPGKSRALVVDLWDELVPALADQAQARLAGYRAMGFQVRRANA
jgi:superfamily II DNA or RNA helicase